mgnify:CR=1 FL=1
MDRKAGVLMHISSLPSPHGIGTLGKAAYDFVDFLYKAGQKYWQVGFGITGSVLGEVGGLVESDGKSCNLTLNAEKPETCRILERKRRELRRELEGGALPVSFIGISQRAPETERDVLLAGRGLDITV